MNDLHAESAAPRGLAARAVLALALLVGFYVMAVAIAGTLLLLPYLEWRFAHRLHIKLAIGAVLGAGAILIAIMPRPEPFKQPGPRMGREHAPRLFDLIDDVAAKTGQEVPSEVYLVPEVNAWVGQRGDVMGFGGKRIMGLGLPVFPALTVSELRAVLAHEFGHYAGGDTNLGGIIHATRSAIGRTLRSLSGDGENPGLLQQPFMAYGNMFLRITQSISREQERGADRLAAAVESPAALAGGLRKLHVLDSAYGAYMNAEINPALRARVLPPVTEGLSRFLSAPRVRTQYAQALDTVVEDSRRAAGERAADEALFDSHPPLHERVDALAHLPAGPSPASDPLATSLVDDWPLLERAMVEMMLEHEAPPAIAWEEAGTKVLLHHYGEEAQLLREALAGVTVEAVGRDLDSHGARALDAWKRALEKKGAKFDGVDLGGRPVGLIGMTIVLTLHGNGWAVRTGPGEPVVLWKHGRSFDPYEALNERSAGRLDAEGWSRRCAELGIGALPIVIPPARERRGEDA